MNIIEASAALDPSALQVQITSGLGVRHPGAAFHWGVMRLADQVAGQPPIMRGDLTIYPRRPDAVLYLADNINTTVVRGPGDVIANEAQIIQLGQQGGFVLYELSKGERYHMGSIHGPGSNLTHGGDTKSPSETGFANDLEDLYD